jgi:hypothetical protein
MTKLRAIFLLIGGVASCSGEGAFIVCSPGGHEYSYTVVHEDAKFDGTSIVLEGAGAYAEVVFPDGSWIRYEFGELPPGGP